jgi:hypothetical protein
MTVIAVLPAAAAMTAVMGVTAVIGMLAAAARGGAPGSPSAAPPRRIARP